MEIEQVIGALLIIGILLWIVVAAVILSLIAAARAFVRRLFTIVFTVRLGLKKR
jgi:hypothetical protein